jgi:hypothetical protein
MRFAFALFVLLILTRCLEAQDLTLPKEIKFPAGKLCRVEAKTTAKTILWRVPSAVDVDDLRSPKLLCTAPPGSYTLTCIACTDTGIAVADCVLIVEGAEPGPQPRPNDPFKTELKKLAESANAEEVARVASLYRFAAAEATKAEYATIEALLAVISEAANLIKVPTCAAIRARVRDELATQLGDTDGPETRQKAKAIYTLAADALEGK